MSKKITPEETSQLFLFCHKHFVYHYDLQVELVDHLASSIEEQWETNADLTFKEGLRNSFAKFGIHGFSKIKQQKEKELSRKYNRILWNYLLEFYRWPKMLMTLAFTMVLFTLLKVINNDLWVLGSYFTILAFFILFYYYKIFPGKFKIETQPGKSFMLLNQLKQVQQLTVLTVQIPFQIINFENILKLQFINNTLGLFTISLFTVTLTIALYGNLFYIPQKIKEHFMIEFGAFAV